MVPNPLAHCCLLAYFVSALFVLWLPSSPLGLSVDLSVDSRLCRDRHHTVKLYRGTPPSCFSTVPTCKLSHGSIGGRQQQQTQASYHHHICWR